MKENSTSTVQQLFAGKYDRHFLFTKAEFDLDRMMTATSPFKYHYALIDYSIDVKHLAEWYWHELVKVESDWIGKNEKDFIAHLKKISAEFRVFDEIANTVKHHTRTNQNTIVNMIQLHRDQDRVITDPAILEDCLTWNLGQTNT